MTRGIANWTEVQMLYSGCTTLNNTATLGVFRARPTGCSCDLHPLHLHLKGEGWCVSSCMFHDTACYTSYAFGSEAMKYFLGVP